MSFYGFVKPLLYRFAPECAHALVLLALRSGLVSGGAVVQSPLLRTSVWGMDFPNPLGLAAGFDKDAQVIKPLSDVGFGFVETGSITPEPQPGNPKPRLFRLSEDRAVINRMGFNSRGRRYADARLDALRCSGYRGIIGVNLGKNKTSDDAAADYRVGAQSLAHYADYLVINVSSPNTPGLRALQSKAELNSLIDAVRPVLTDLDNPPALVLKIAPDLAQDDLRDIADLSCRLDGLIISNTTVARPAGLRSVYASETGGLSGEPLFDSATAVLAELYRLTGGSIPLVGVGGISSAQQAYTKIKQGASLIQLYSALVYGGPRLVNDILRGLVALLEEDGFSSVQEAVGCEVTL